MIDLDEMLTPEDFPITCYGAAVFRATSDVPLMVAPTRELAEEIASRLNVSEMVKTGRPIMRPEPEPNETGWSKPR